jgi:hypothetical protein
VEYISTAHIVGFGLMGLFVLLSGAFARRRERASKPRNEVVIKRTRQVATFETLDSRNGVVQLVVYQEYLDAGTKGDPAAERKGRRRIMTTDGRLVDKIATRKYRVMGGTETLTTEDPNAP